MSYNPRCKCLSIDIKQLLDETYSNQVVHHMQTLEDLRAVKILGNGCEPNARGRKRLSTLFEAIVAIKTLRRLECYVELPDPDVRKVFRAGSLCQLESLQLEVKPEGFSVWADLAVLIHTTRSLRHLCLRCGGEMHPDEGRGAGDQLGDAIAANDTLEELRFERNGSLYVFST